MTRYTTAGVVLESATVDQVMSDYKAADARLFAAIIVTVIQR